MHAPILLQLRGICKRYPGVQALRDAALEVRAGEVHVLLGENGAGKSTLMKVLSGAVRRDAGEILLNGQAVDIADPAAARRLGISTIYQELSLVPHLSVAENIFLGKAPTRWSGIIDWTTMRLGASTLVTSSAQATGVPPAERAASAIFLSADWSRPTRTIDAPSPAKARAAACPMPLVAPVTMTVLP